MKLNKLVSSVLAFVMIVTSFAALLPVVASAASPIAVNVKTDDDRVSDMEAVIEICNDYMSYNFSTAKEMLDYELEKGYLDSITRGNFAVYINRFTGVMYYVNNLTGQILTSNFIDPAYQTIEGGQTVTLDKTYLGQVSVSAFNIDGTAKYEYNSFEWIMEGSLLSVSKSAEDGISVEYILGNAFDAFIIPDVMTLDTFNKDILHPAFEKLQSLLNECCGPFNSATAAAAKAETSSPSLNWRMKSTSYNVLEDDIYRKEVYFETYLSSALDNYVKYAAIHLGEGFESNAKYIEIYNHVTFIKSFFENYNIIKADNTSDKKNERIPVILDGVMVVLLDGAEDKTSSIINKYRSVEKAIKYLRPGLTQEQVDIYEQECGFTADESNIPSFKVTLVYTIDEDGNLVVDVPANAISYDKEIYSVASVSTLKYFGAGNMIDDGYVFYPDGSGTVIDFDDFYFTEPGRVSPSVNVESKVYGADYCYSAITGAHREQITMPVYGIVSQVNANNLGYSAGLGQVTNGFLAIIEDGASLTSIVAESRGSTHKYMGAYTIFAPFPSDTYDLSASLSVGSLSNYTVVAPASYEGKLRTKYVMLVDESIYAKALLVDPGFVGYIPSYVGMANCYRDYLKNNGVLSALAKQDNTAPLYVEVLGSMKVSKRFLSFPITVSEALTTFSDVERMYNEFSGAKATLTAKAQALRAEADKLREEDATKHSVEIAKKIAKAEEYEALASKCSNATDVNFRLTGFVNGGLHYTYPAKVKWEKSLGGKKGINALLDTAKEVNASGNGNFGIYPDFDFMYINNTSWFDGINPKKAGALMVDNRYASKQSYNSISQQFETLFALAVSTDSMAELYQKFLKKYSKFDMNGISVSTMGSDLNSNFDSDNPVIRENSIAGITSLLNTMSETYSVMTDKGNAYTLKYVDHILNASLDASHFNFSSYAVPFYGMVLHGYVQYAGTPLNFSGSPSYEILRSIESGASLYYVLCAQNYSYLKEDPLLSKYYGVYYENWFEKIIEQYSILNSAVGDLQNHGIVDHSIVYAERVLNPSEQNVNNNNLIEEFLSELSDVISDGIYAKRSEMRDDPAMIGKGLEFVVTDADKAVLAELCAQRLNVSVDELNAYSFGEKLSATIESYRKNHNSGEVKVNLADMISKVDYKSKYSYVTDSFATDKDYVETDYTCDNGNVVLVTYEKEENGVKSTVTFILNYNLFSVKIKVNEDTHANYAEYCDADGYITLDSYGYVKIQ